MVAAGSRRCGHPGPGFAYLYQSVVVASNNVHGTINPSAQPRLRLDAAGSEGASRLWIVLLLLAYPILCEPCSSRGLPIRAVGVSSALVESPFFLAKVRGRSLLLTQAGVGPVGWTRFRRYGVDSATISRLRFAKKVCIDAVEGVDCRWHRPRVRPRGRWHSFLTPGRQGGSASSTMRLTALPTRDLRARARRPGGSPRRATRAPSSFVGAGTAGIPTYSGSICGGWHSPKNVSRSSSQMNTRRGAISMSRKLLNARLGPYRLLRDR